MSSAICVLSVKNYKIVVISIFSFNILKLDLSHLSFVIDLNSPIIFQRRREKNSTVDTHTGLKLSLVRYIRSTYHSENEYLLREVSHW